MMMIGKITAMKFNLVISEKIPQVEYRGVGNLCASPPVIAHSAQGNGACLFNSFSVLLTGRDTFSVIIHHVVCNYISNPMKYKWLKAYIPSQFKSGKEYIIASSMCNFTTWGTEVKIIAFAQVSGFDMYVYTRNSGWLQYGHCIDNGEDDKSECAFFLSNESGFHFDPVFAA